jgi:hypothetical protein
VSGSLRERLDFFSGETVHNSQSRTTTDSMAEDSLELPSDVESDMADDMKDTVYLPDDITHDVPDDTASSVPSTKKQKVDKPKRNHTARKKDPELDMIEYPSGIELGGTRAEMMQSIRGTPTMPQWVRDILVPRGDEIDPCDAFMEVFSPPRISVWVGPLGGLAIDLKTGWNLLADNDLERLFIEIRVRQPQVIMLCPPCTSFSRMQRSNWGRTDKQMSAHKAAAGVRLLDISMWIAEYQMRNNRAFCFEHPADAESWVRPKVVSIREMPGVMTARFDMCKFGLVSKIEKKPIQKSTWLMTNMEEIMKAFDGVVCRDEHVHQQCHGYEGGQSRASYAQEYPKDFCITIAECTKKHIAKKK